MTGLANWVEVALFFTGIVLLLVEILVIPGFGIAGILGIICIAAGLFGMLIKNPPDKLPWPQSILDWHLLISGVQGIIVGVIGFVFLSWLLSKYIPKAQFLSGLSLAPSQPNEGQEIEISMTSPDQAQGAVKPGDRGIIFSTLRPAGKVRFGEAIVDCVCPADFLEKGTQVEITKIHGNRVVVKRI
jgi:membrane-bound serine protease (ClpP class)